MSTAEAQITESSVKEDIEEFLGIYSEISQYGQTQLTRYTEELKEYTKTYRRTHTQLKRLCNPDEYTELYGHFDNLVEQTKTWFKAAAAREAELTAAMAAMQWMKEREEKEEEKGGKRWKISRCPWRWQIPMLTVQVGPPDTK